MGCCQATTTIVVDLTNKRSWPSKKSSCEEIVFSHFSLFCTRVATIHQKEFFLSVCIVARALFVLPKRVGLHCGRWNVFSMCMKTTKIHSCCLVWTLMFVLKLLSIKGILLLPNLFLFVKVLLCIVYWIVEAFLCFIAMCRIEVHCKHGVCHWF